MKLLELKIVLFLTGAAVGEGNRFEPCEVSSTVGNWEGDAEGITCGADVKDGEAVGRGEGLRCIVGCKLGHKVGLLMGLMLGCAVRRVGVTVGGPDSDILNCDGSADMLGKAVLGSKDGEDDVECAVG